MKYKFGDKVRVRRDLRISTNYGDYMFVSGMDDYKGNVVTISEVYQTYYCIEEDIGTWIWTDEMFDSSMTNGEMIRSMSDGKIFDG